MRITRIMAMALLVAAVSVPAMADDEHHPEDAAAQAAPSSMPMTSGQMPMANGQMPMMKMMEERHALMQAHMTKMETHMANMEKLLQQLVDLQKK